MASLASAVVLCTWSAAVAPANRVCVVTSPWSMQYINDEPALCMWRRSNTLGEQMRLGSGKRVFAICLSSLWKYIDHRGNLDVKTATLEAMREVVQMGFGDPGKARGAVHNIIGVMDDKLEDLLRMKPRPDGYTDTLAPEIRMGEFIVRPKHR